MQGSSTRGVFLAVPCPFSSGILLFTKWARPMGKQAAFYRERRMKRMGNPPLEQVKGTLNGILVRKRSCSWNQDRKLQERKKQVGWPEMDFRKATHVSQTKIRSVASKSCLFKSKFGYPQLRKGFQPRRKGLKGHVHSAYAHWLLDRCQIEILPTFGAPVR